MNKVFQIWVDYGHPMTERVAQAMAENMEKADHYTLIAEKNPFGCRDFRPYAQIEAEALKDSRVRDMFRQKNKWVSTDVIRTWFLWKHPEYTYLDADLRLLQPLKSDRGSPAFARYDTGIDGFLIAGNGHGDFFDSMLTRMHSLSPAECFPMIASLPQDWSNVIEPGYFEHFNQNRLDLPDVLADLAEESA